MRNTTITASLFIALVLADPGGALGECRVRLKSGREIVALRSWTEDGIVHLQLNSGAMTVPESDVTGIDEIRTPQSLPPAHAVRPGPSHETAAHQVDDESDSGADDSQVPDQQTPPPLAVDEKVPEVAHEDLQTKMERLDGLSMQTHRQLSIARTQGQPKETLDALQHKIEGIDRQRTATMKRLGTLR